MALEEYLNETTDLIKVDEGQLIIAEQMKQALIMIEHQKKQLDADEKAMKKQLEEVMREHKITGYESNDRKIKISLGEDTTNYDLDKDLLLEKYPDIYRECNTKEVKRKGSLRITIREAKDGVD